MDLRGSCNIILLESGRAFCKSTHWVLIDFLPALRWRDVWCCYFWSTGCCSKESWQMWKKQKGTWFLFVFDKCCLWLTESSRRLYGKCLPGTRRMLLLRILLCLRVGRCEIPVHTCRWPPFGTSIFYGQYGWWQYMSYCICMSPIQSSMITLVSASKLFTACIACRCSMHSEIGCSSKRQIASALKDGNMHGVAREDHNLLCNLWMVFQQHSCWAPVCDGLYSTVGCF